MGCSASLLPFPLAPSIFPDDSGLGLIYGLLTALVFSIAPLGRAHDLPVPTLIRDLVEERQAWPRRRYLCWRCARRAALSRLPSSTSPQQRSRSIVVGATIAAFSRCGLSPWHRDLARRAPRSRVVEWRMALATIHRPGALTPSVVLSLGLGLTVLVALTLDRGQLRAELREAQPGETPSFYFPRCARRRRGPFVDFVKREAPGVKVERDADDARALRADRRQAGRTGQGQARRSPGRWRAIAASPSPTRRRRAPRSSQGHGGRATIPGRRWSRWRRRWPTGLGLHLGDTIVVNVLGRDISGEARESAQGELAQLRDQFRAGLFARHVQRRAVHRTRLSRAARPSRRTPSSTLMRDVAQQFPERRQRPGARRHGQRRNAGRQACARDPRGDGRRALRPRSWCLPARSPPIGARASPTRRS